LYKIYISGSINSFKTYCITISFHRIVYRSVAFTGCAGRLLW